MNYTENFLTNIEKISTQQIPEQVLHKAKNLLTNYLGVTIAGAACTRSKTVKLLSASLDMDGACPVIGIGKTVNIEKALLVNGLNAHALDFDDGTNTGIIHLGSPDLHHIITFAAAWAGFC